jgi:hypothetical protein
LDQEIEKKIENYTKQINDADGNYSFKMLMQDFKTKALEDDIAIWFLFKKIINDSIAEPDYFLNHFRKIISTFYILNEIDDDRAYSLLKHFIKNCSEETPIGAIELLSTLMTSFPYLKFEDYFEYSKSQNQAQSAIGFLICYNLLMEAKLTKDQSEEFYDFAKKYKNKRYYINETSEMIRYRINELYENKNFNELNIIE